MNRGGRFRRGGVVGRLTGLRVAQQFVPMTTRPTSNYRRLSALAGAWILAMAGCSGIAAEWPQWRGPDRTGRASSDTPALSTLPAAPRVVWRVPAGEGFASPVVAGGRVFAMEAQDGKEVLRALDAEDGRERWRATIDETFRDSQGPPAPRCTPMAVDGRVYAQSCKGELVCLEAASGTRLWAVNYTRDFGAVFIGEKGNAPGATRHGNNGSPWVSDGVVYASAGSTNGAAMVALDAKTGAVRWKGGSEVASYAAPMIAEIGGTRQVVNFMADAVVGLEAASGTVLWRYPLKTAFARHVMTPLILGDTVILGSHQTGLMALKIARQGAGWSATQAWINREAAPNFSCPVAVGHWVFGLGPKRDVLCVDAREGTVAWAKTGWMTTPPDKAHVGMVTVGGKTVLMLTDGGELILFSAEGTECKELGRAQVCGANWCNPALVGTRIYLRDGGKGTGSWWCLDLKP